MALPEGPQSRAEQYLAKIAGQAASLPEAPRSRVEQYLDYIAENGTVSKEEIAEQVSTWLSKNIHEDSTVVIDKSLSVEGAAADAKAVGTTTITNKGLAYNVCTSCNEVHENSILFVSSTGGVTTVSDYAWSDSAGWLVSIQTNKFTLQIAFPYNTTSLKPKYRRYTGSAWSSWSAMYA